MSGQLALYVGSFAAFSLLWGKVLWYADERSQLVRDVVFQLMAHTRWKAPEIKSMLLTLLYLTIGTAGVVGFSWVYGIKASTLLATPRDSFFIILLGIFAEVSLSNLLMNLLFSLTNLRVNPVKVMNEIPWIEGINRLPPRVRPAVPAVAGFLEETFFRGVGILILTQHFKVAPLLAVLLSTVFFVIEQVVQTRTALQGVMMGLSCLAISAVGGLLVVITNSGVAAAVAHASFVMFYFQKSET